MTCATEATPTPRVDLGEHVASIQDAMSYLDAMADAPGDLPPEVVSRLDRVRVIAWEVVGDLQQRRNPSARHATTAMRDLVP